jgi:Uma2 family endonuclease
MTDITAHIVPPLTLTLPPVGDASTVADLIDRLGGIPPERIRLKPPPGQATVADVIEIEGRENRICELIEGVLVEKAMGFRAGFLTSFLVFRLRSFVDPANLGLVNGADGMMQIFPSLVRIPDVAFASWSRFPSGRVPEEPVPHLVPDLAVEVLSRWNTRREMDRKVDEYFAAGVRLVWLVDPAKRVVTVYTSANDSRTLSESDTLNGGDVLPGFTLPLTEWFAELDRRAGGK